MTKYHSHNKQGKQPARKIKYSKTASRKKPLYKLVSITKDNLKSLNQAESDLKTKGITNPDYDAWCAEVSYYKPLIEGME